jgi:hypothetical protein
VLSQKIGNCSSTLWIAERGHDAAGLIKEHDSLRRRMNRATIDLDFINVRIDLSAELRAHLAVYLNSSFNDEPLHLATRSNTTLREKLL